MAHGTPDWYGIAPKEQTYVMEDDAELAARLDSPLKWDRRGDVIWMQTFESGLKDVNLWGAGVGNAQYLSTAMPFHGHACLHLVTGDAVGDQARGNYHLPQPSLGAWGEQMWTSFDDQVDTVNMWLRLFNGSDQIVAGVAYDLPAAEVRIYLEGVGWTTIDTDVNLYAHESYYHIFKVVGRYDSRNYERLIIDDRVYLLSEYEMYSTPSIAAPYVSLEFAIDTAVAANAHANIDNLIYTINEPT